MSRRISSIEDQLLSWIYIIIDPVSPCLERSSVSLNSIKLRVENIAFFIIIFPASSNCISKLHQRINSFRIQSLISLQFYLVSKFSCYHDPLTFKYSTWIPQFQIFCFGSSILYEKLFQKFLLIFLVFFIDINLPCFEPRPHLLSNKCHQSIVT